MLSIIIGAYNEENRIRQSIIKINEFLINRNASYEIIIVDDGSTDRTKEVILEVASVVSNLRLIHYKKNRGKGYALRKGVSISKGDHILVSDADLSTPIEELDTLLPYLSDHCIAIGSRALPTSNIIKRQPLWRQGMGKVFNSIVKLLLINDFNDTQCGFKLFAGDIARNIFQEARIERFAYDVEILCIAKKMGYTIAEVPITWINDPTSKVRPIYDSLRMLLDVIIIKFSIGTAYKDVIK